MFVRHLSAPLLLVLTITACAHRAAVDPAGDRAVLLQRQTAFLAAVGARDLDGVMTHFAPDAVLHVANMSPVRGADAIRRFYGNVFRFMSESTATPEVTRLAGSADVAYTVGTVRNVFAGERGRQEFTGKFSLVWERRDGEWRVVLYTVSSDQPADGG